jgi:hypothetical protein
MRLRQEIALRDEPQDEQPGAPAIGGRGSAFVQLVGTLRRRQEEYPVSLSLKGMEQPTPKVIHLDSPESAQRWLPEFVQSKRRQTALEQL